MQEVERIISELRSIHLAILLAIRHFYYIQQAQALIQASHHQAYLSNNAHCEIAHWKQLCQSMEARATYLVEIVQRLTMDLRFVDTSGLGAGCVWLDPNSNKEHSVWRVEWPPDVVADLVSWDNPKGRITNSNLELVAIVI